MNEQGIDVEQGKRLPKTAKSSAIAAFTLQDISVVRAAKSYKTHITKLLKRS